MKGEPHAMKSNPDYSAGERKTRKMESKAFLPTSSSLAIDIRAAVLNLSVTVKSLEVTSRKGRTQISQAVPRHLNHHS